ncbi:MAG: Ppx/GppA family phosphatase [Nitrospiraceae bacterium]|nr:Ppx/GppA family phosphatase [Nitrospiraceae bacterium]
MLVAGIDIGTLTCRLLVARVELPYVFQEMDADRRILRLGEGVDTNKTLSDAAMDRVVTVLKEWKTKLAAYPLDHVVIVATSAVRDASNRQRFLHRVSEAVGWQVEVLSGAEEARRTLLGMQCGLPPNITQFLALDIGGGSTEFIRVGADRACDDISLDLGVVRLTERALVHDPPTPHDLKVAEEEIIRQLDKAKQHFSNVWPPTLVGTAGTITTLAAMDQGLTRYDSALVHNYVLPLETIRRLEEDIMSKSSGQRLEMPGLEAGREQVMAAGTLILRMTMESFGYDHCLVSDYGLREGVLVDLVTKHTAERLRLPPTERPFPPL